MWGSERLGYSVDGAEERRDEAHARWQALVAQLAVRFCPCVCVVLLPLREASAVNKTLVHADRDERPYLGRGLGAVGGLEANVALAAVRSPSIVLHCVRWNRL